MFKIRRAQEVLSTDLTERMLAKLVICKFVLAIELSSVTESAPVVFQL